MFTDEQRTCGLHVTAPKGEPYGIIVERETLRTYEDGNSKRLLWSEVKRIAGDIVKKPLPEGPVTIATYGELQALIAKCADELAAEDQTAAAKRVAAQQAQEAVAEKAAESLRGGSP